MDVRTLAVQPDVKGIYCLPNALNSAFPACNQTNEIFYLLVMCGSDVVSGSCDVASEGVGSRYYLTALASFVPTGGITSVDEGVVWIDYLTGVNL